jgi:hypothetical protein
VIATVRAVVDRQRTKVHLQRQMAQPTKSADMPTIATTLVQAVYLQTRAGIPTPPDERKERHDRSAYKSPLSQIYLLVPEFLTVGIKDFHLGGGSKLRRPSGPGETIERKHRNGAALGSGDHNFDPTVRDAYENIVTVALSHHDQANCLQEVGSTGGTAMDT